MGEEGRVRPSTFDLLSSIREDSSYSWLSRSHLDLIHPRDEPVGVFAFNLQPVTFNLQPASISNIEYRMSNDEGEGRRKG